MSNNIYNILGKLNALAPKETPKTVEQKPVYESVAARGSVLEGVAAVESRLSQMFAEEKANEDMIAKKDYDGDGKKESPKDEYMGSKDKAIKKAMNKDKVDEESHGEWLKKKESEAQQSGKKSFQAFKQTHPVDGKPGVEEAEEEEESLEEGWDDMLKAVKDRAGPQPSGGSGIKQGKRYGGGQQKDDEGDDEPAADNAPKKKGRPKKDKFAEVAPPGAKAERMVKHIKKGYAKDGKITPKEKSIAFATAWKAHNKNKLKEGVNFAEMMREANAEADELLTELQIEIAEFKKSGHMGDKLRDVLELHKFSKKPVVDEVVMPAPVAESGAFIPGRTVYWRGKEGTVDRVEGNKCFVIKPSGDMDVWPTRECSTEKQGMIDTLKKDVSSIGQGIKNFVMNKPDPVDEELNELAKLAGLSEAKKCNHTMEGKKCPVHGLKECGSGMYESAKPDYIDLDKDGDKEESMKDAAKDAKQTVKEDLQADDGEHYRSADDFFGKFEADWFDDEVESDDGMEIRGYIDGVNVMAWRFDDESRTSGYGVYNDDMLAECGPGTMSPMSSMGQDDGSLSINTSMNSDGTKSVSVNATGNQADALAQMLKMAGLSGIGRSEVQEPKAMVIQAGPEESVEEERDVEYANTPDEEVENVDAIMHQGNDLHREKEQYAGMPKAGDNPMATRESIEMPARISKMLEGVKLVDAK